MGISLGTSFGTSLYIGLILKLIIFGSVVSFISCKVIYIYGNSGKLLILTCR